MYVRDWGTTRLADALRHQLTDAWAVIEPNLAGLTDEEYLWEPPGASGCWGIRLRDEAAAPLVWGKGEWVVESSWEPPTPPPFTTVGWRLMHGYDCLNDYFARGMHLGLKDWNDIEVPGHAAEAVALMTDLVLTIDETLGAIDDELLRRQAEHDPRPAWATVQFGMLEATHHCAEVGVLRSLIHVTA